MVFIEWELFHDKRRNLIDYEKLPPILLQRVLMIFIEGSSSTINEGI
jgi:hypothetical protein